MPRPGAGDRFPLARPISGMLRTAWLREDRASRHLGKPGGDFLARLRRDTGHVLLEARPGKRLDPESCWLARRWAGLPGEGIAYHRALLDRGGVSKRDLEIGSDDDVVTLAEFLANDQEELVDD